MLLDDGPSVAEKRKDSENFQAGNILYMKDSEIPIEEFIYFAKLSRARELSSPSQPGHITASTNATNSGGDAVDQPVKESGGGMAPLNCGDVEHLSRVESKKKPTPEAFAPLDISEGEWTQASRAARTATWVSIFYLITTDVLGPFSTGYAFSQMGLAPGVVLYTVFGALAGYSGFLLWRLFLQLDSDEHPLGGYSDLALRIYGPWFQHVCNILQSFQFFLTVMVIMITNGQSISQLSQNKLCFIISVLTSALAGCVIGQIRTLKNLGWVGSVSVFLNLFVIFVTMGVMAHSPPNYILYATTHPEFNIQAPDPISVSITAPPELTLVDNVNGLMNAVFSFGGATMFVELMAEMRRPMDFWKGLLCADLLIFLCYMVYGIYCYVMQGQYAYINSYQGISPYNWQTVCNAIELLTNVIAAVLYANIGMKVLYNSVGRHFFTIPDLNSASGKWIWAFFVPVYWMLAWVVALSVPQITSWTVLVGAGALLQFTYTFPVFLALGFRAQRDSALPEEVYDPLHRRVERVDHGLKRWVRGLRKELWWNIFDGVIYVGSLVTCVLGLYAGFKTLVEGYIDSPSLVGWQCSSPTG
ncbi:hypothetical protein N5P37_004766 [Trichoderma harzianum]|nr:hypothetical protein N5P37_004766 [Trichoderma harzianum]